MITQLIVEDFYVEEIIKELAEKMNTSFVEEENMTRFDLPENKGKGFFKATQFACGIGTIEATYKLNEELHVKMEKNKINPLKFVFNLGETIYHKFENDENFNEIKKYEGAIIGGTIHDVHIFKLPKNKSLNVFSLELNRNLFEHKVERFNLNDELKSLFKDVKAKNPFFFAYNFGASEYELIKKIFESKKTGFIGALHKEGISYSLLSYTLETYLNRKGEQNKEILDENEIDTILKISNFISKNLGDLPTIDVIAKQHFISEIKIQKLFQNYYNCSVHDFIRNKRLSQARKLIETSKLSLSEIANDLGIRSNSYFSKIFKERYGVAPSEYRGSRLSKIRFY